MLKFPLYSNIAEFLFLSFTSSLLLPNVHAMNYNSINVNMYNNNPGEQKILRTGDMTSLKRP